VAIRVEKKRRHYTCVEDGSVIVQSGFRGLWIKTHVSVVLVACPYCFAVKGAPCLRTSGHPGSSTHYLRRRDAAKSVAGE
jgi:hypothetical protein